MDEHALARSFAVGLGAARLAVGLGEVMATRRYLALLGGGGADDDAAALWLRMKGARDLVLAVLTLSVAGHDRRLAALTSTGVVIDTIDGIAVLADRGHSLRPAVHVLGGVLGLCVGAASAWAWATLDGRR